MKVLTTEAQQDLQELLDALATAENLGTSIEQHANLAYWAIELKPKRVRRKSEIALSSEAQIVVDNIT